MSAHAEHEVYAGRLIGRHVCDAGGKRIGRVADIVAHRDGNELVFTEYLIGPHGWLERFAIHGLGLRFPSVAWRYHVKWDQMDLSDPIHPRLTCDAGDLHVEHMPSRKRGLKRRPARRLA